MKIYALVIPIICLMLSACSSSRNTNTSPYPNDPDYNSPDRIKAREHIREEMRKMNLEIVYRGEAHWPSNFKNLSEEEKLVKQEKTMDQIRSGNGFWVIPLTKEQVQQLDDEGCFSSIDTTIKKSASK